MRLATSINPLDQNLIGKIIIDVANEITVYKVFPRVNSTPAFTNFLAVEGITDFPATSYLTDPADLVNGAVDSVSQAADGNAYANAIDFTPLAINAADIYDESFIDGSGNFDGDSIDFLYYLASVENSQVYIIMDS